MSNQVELQRHDYSLVVSLAAKGVNEASIADALWISPATFKALKKRDPQLIEALELGRAAEHDALVGRLRRLADDGNVVALLFLLKARHGYRDQGPDTNAVQAVAVNITLPEAKTREEYERELAIDVTPSRSQAVVTELRSSRARTRRACSRFRRTSTSLPRAAAAVERAGRSRSRSCGTARSTARTLACWSCVTRSRACVTSSGPSRATRRRLRHARTYNSQEHIFRLPNGATVELNQIEGPADLQKFQGRGFTMLCVDEVAQYADPADVEVLRSNLRGARDIPLRVIWSCNPGGVGHAGLWKRFISKATPWRQFVDEKSGRTWVIAPSTLEDNQHVDRDDYRRQLETATRTTPSCGARGS